MHPMVVSTQAAASGAGGSAVEPVSTGTGYAVSLANADCQHRHPEQALCRRYPAASAMANGGTVVTSFSGAHAEALARSGHAGRTSNQASWPMHTAAARQVMQLAGPAARFPCSMAQGKHAATPRLALLQHSQ